MRLIAIVNARYRLPLQANELDLRVYRALRKNLARERIYLIVGSPDRADHVRHQDGIGAVYVGQRGPRLLQEVAFALAALRIAHRLVAARGSVLMASDPLVAGLIAIVAGKLRHVPTLVHLQGDLFDVPRQVTLWRRFAMRFMATFVCRRADMVRCVSKSLMSKALKHGVRTDRIVYVPSRCDTDRFHRPPLADAGRVLRREMGFEPDATVALFVGALTVHKGIPHLITSFAKAADINSGLRLAIVGDGPLLQEAQRRVDELGLTQRVRFRGSRPYSEIPSHMAAADLFLLPSLDEGMPRVILEAMAMELIVVASDVGGVGEVVSNEVNGFLVKPASDDELAQTILRAIYRPDPGLRSRARATVVSKYGFDSGIRAYANALRVLVGAPPQHLGQ